MKQTGVSEQLIRNYCSVANFSKVLPFRFVAAARYVPGLEDMLESAMFKATAEMPKLNGKTAIVIDNSGSMSGQLSAKSDMTRSDAACALAMLVREICDQCVVISYGSSAKVVANRRGFALRDAVQRADVGHATNTEDAIRLANTEGYDRIIVITDEQSHQDISGPKGKGYVINVASYQNGIGYGKWTHIDGWSDAILTYVKEFESDI